MFRYIALGLWAGLCLAQPAPGNAAGPPPPGVDEALRARIKEFYQLQVDAKYRQAEALVAEDSKDAYYNSQKPKYLNFEMRDIEYSNDFTHAKATVACETIVNIAGFTGTPLKIPMRTYWKLENGEWFWYLDNQQVRQTPFGPTVPSAGSRPAGSPPVLPPVLPTNTGFVMGKVKADKGAAKAPAKKS